MIDFVFSTRARVIGLFVGIFVFTNFGTSLFSFSLSSSGPKEQLWIGLFGILLNGCALVVKKIPDCSRVYKVLSILSILALAAAILLVGFLLIII